MSLFRCGGGNSGQYELAIPGAIWLINTANNAYGTANTFGYDSITKNIDVRGGYYYLIVNCKGKSTVTLTRANSSQTIASGGGLGLVGDTVTHISFAIGDNDVTNYDYVGVALNMGAVGNFTITVT